MGDTTEYTEVHTPSGKSKSNPIAFDAQSFEPTGQEEVPQILQDANNYYQLLSLEPSVTDEKIVTRTYELMNKWHPDNCDKDNGKVVFKQVNRARQILTDEQKRSIYDDLGHKQYIDKARRGNILDQITKEKYRQNKLRNRKSRQTTTESAKGIQREQTQQEQQKNEVNESLKFESDIFNEVDFATIDKSVTQKQMYNMSVQYLYKQLWSYKIILFTIGFVLYNGLVIASLQLLPESTIQLSGFPVTLTGALYTSYIVIVTAIMYLLVSEAEAVAPDEFIAGDSRKTTFEKDQPRSKQESQTSVDSGRINYTTGNKYDPSRTGSSNGRGRSESGTVTDKSNAGSSSEQGYNRNSVLISEQMSVSAAITTAVAILGIGAVATQASAVEPVEFLFRLFFDNTISMDAVLWVTGIPVFPDSFFLSVQILLSLEIMLLAVYSLAVFWYSFGKRVWMAKYMQNFDVSPTAYEVGMSIIPVILSGGVVTGATSLTSTEIYSSTPLIAQDGSLTGGSLLFAGCIYIIAVAYYYKFRTVD